MRHRRPLPRGEASPLFLRKESRRRERGDPKIKFQDQRVLYKIQDARCFDCQEDLPHSEALLKADGRDHALTARCHVVPKTLPHLGGDWERGQIALVCPVCYMKRHSGGTRRGS